MKYVVRIKPLAFFTALLCLLSINSLADAAHQILDKMSHGMREINYDGVFVYQHDDAMHSFRIIHSVVDGKEKERLVYLDGEHREVIRHNHSATCIHPGEKRTRLNHGINAAHVPKKIVDNVMAVDENYQIALGSRSRIAGHEVDILSITSGNDDRYSYRLMIETAYGVLLGFEIIGLNGEILETFRFTSVAINQLIEPSLLQAQTSKPTVSQPHHNDAIKNTNPESKKELKNWRLGFIPQGFTPTLELPEQKKAVSYESQGYTDGLATFTVFVESVDKPLVKPEYRQQGATTLYSHNKMLKNQVLLVTVVGEIPLAMARRVAENVELVGEKP